MQHKADPGPWLPAALAFVAAVTALRLGLLAFNRTDLFVDESQYWLWGQSFEFGYFSKPPLVAWAIGAVTHLAGSDAPFWVRAPGPVFHAATALILGELARRLVGARAALWVAASYVTLPFVAVGSLLISTDTIMAPFFSAALLFHHQTTSGGGLRPALLTGAMAGLAFLAKYAAFYFGLGVILAAIAVPAMRLRLQDAAAMLAAFTAVILPNILWNLAHDNATVTHTMENVGWVRPDAPPITPDFPGGLEFLASQFAVFGPLLMAALVWSCFHRPLWRGHLAFVLPALIVVTFQAVIDKAYANWAIAAYFAGTIIAVASLLKTRPALVHLSLGINGAICVILPILTLFPTYTAGRDTPLLSRYLGLADMSRRIISAAAAAGTSTIVADDRDILADLFYTGRDSGFTFHARPSGGRAENHYEMNYPLPATLASPVLFVSTTPPSCNGAPVAPSATFNAAIGEYRGTALAAYLINPVCLRP